MVAYEYNVTERGQIGDATGTQFFGDFFGFVANHKQGESLANIVESFVRASHVNVTKGLSAPTGAYMLLQAAMYTRIGEFLTPHGFSDTKPKITGATHLSWLNTEVFRECYSEGQPHDDFVKITFRNCQIVGLLFWEQFCGDVLTPDYSWHKKAITRRPSCG